MIELKLRRKGRDVGLQQQPALVLGLLVERAGSVVTRSELREAIWPNDTHVEFEFGLNTIINRLRRVLGDVAAQPRFIETVPKQGYRFIAPIEFELPVVDGRLALVDMSPSFVEPEQPAPELEEQPPEPAPVARSTHLSVTRNFVIAVMAVAAVIAAFLLRSRWQTPAGQRQGGAVVRSYIALPPGHVPEVVVISPGGDQVVYQVLRDGRRQLYRRVLEQQESIAVPGAEDGAQPFFSPDGKQIGFYTESSIRVWGSAGVRDVVQIPRNFDLRRAIWGDDDFIYYTTSAGIWRVPASGGTSQPVLRIMGRGSPFYFPQQILNGAEPTLLLSTNHGPVDRCIALTKVPAEAPPVCSIQRAMGGQLMTSGHLLYSWHGKLLAAPFDLNTLRLSGSGVEVLGNVAYNGWRGPNATVSKTGTLAYIAAERDHRKLVWVDLRGRETALPAPPAEYEQAEISPDGTRVGVSRQDLRGVWTLWVFDLRNGAWTKLVESEIPYPRLLWSPEGRDAIVSAPQGDAQWVNLYRVSMDAPTKLHRLTEETEFGQYPGAWSKAANSVLFTEGVHPETESDILALPLSGSVAPRVLVATKGSDRTPTFSPDGRWFAYASGAGERDQVYVQRFDQSTPPVQISSEGGTDPAWARDGSRIYFLSEKGALMQIRWRENAPAGVPQQVLPAGFAHARDWWTRPYSIAPDGRFLVIRDTQRREDASSRIEIIVNWADQVERLVPARPQR